MLWLALPVVGVSPRWLSNSLREWFYYITEVWKPASQVPGAQTIWWPAKQIVHGFSLCKTGRI